MGKTVLITVIVKCFYIKHFWLFLVDCFVYNTIMLFEIGNEIRAERKRRKITQDQLARTFGMSRSTISQIEKGIVQDIGIRKVIRILEYLDLELRVRPRGVPPTLEDLQQERELDILKNPEWQVPLREKLR